MNEKRSYIVSIFECVIHSRVHVVMIKGHEEGVHNNAQSDEQVNERIENDERQILKTKTIVLNGDY